MSRDLTSERALLTEAGGQIYAEAAIARLDERASEWGDSFAWTARTVLWDALCQQLVDVGGYAALALRRAELDGMAPRDLERLRALLLAITTGAARAEALVGQARRLAEASVVTEQAT
jgi:hypothetical protein